MAEISSPGTRVTYGSWREGFRDFPDTLRALLADERPTSMCDIGGGAQAALTVPEVEALGLRYTLLDISPAELEKSPAEYHKVCADITQPNLAQGLHERFDLIHSHMLAEHIRKPEVFHSNVFALLNPGGTAIHFMPTLWDPAFVLNRILPEAVMRRALSILQPNRRLEFDQGKFPAYYRWCRGPSQKQVNRYRKIGFEIEVIHAYFGTGYGMRIPGLSRVFDGWTSFFVKHPVPLLTSYCAVVLKKPALVEH